MATKAHLEGNKRYLQSVDEIKIRVKKGRKKEIQEYVKGFTPQLSVNEYINKLIDHDMEKE